MKKVFLFLVIIFSLSFYVSAQKNNDAKILILDFDGDKLLTKDCFIVVVYPNSPGDYWLELAHKGENQRRFLRRITRHENYLPSKTSVVLPKDSLKGKKIVVVDKNQMPPMKPALWLFVVCLALLTIILYIISSKKSN